MTKPAPLTLKALNDRLDVHISVLHDHADRLDRTERLREQSHARNTLWGRLRWLLTGR